jgi:hypothetical protein
MCVFVNWARLRCRPRKRPTPPRAAPHRTTPHRTQPIVEALSAVIASCGRRNLRIVCDAITTCVQVAGRRAMQQQPAAVQQLLVPLFQRLQQQGLTEQVRVPVSGCLLLLLLLLLQA